jgi:DMSO/TMAO reductase YedYZ heme-binding membrane subunit
LPPWHERLLLLTLAFIPLALLELAKVLQAWRRNSGISS